MLIKLESLIAHTEHCEAVLDVVCFAAPCLKRSGEQDEVSQLTLVLTHRPPLTQTAAASVTIRMGKASVNAAREW